MKIVNYGETSPENLILALGYFDAVHKGHTAVLTCAVNLAKKHSKVAGALIFTGGKCKKDVFSLEERIRKISSLGIEVIIVKPLDKAFMSKTKTEFLQEITALYNVEKVVSGEDFTFGNGAQGNVSTLVQFFGEDRVITQKLLYDGDEKYSSTKIKSALSNGDIKQANFYLGDRYFISGEVLRGKGLGAKIGFPTANLKISEEKFPLASGVYSTVVDVDGVFYKAITNCGEQPTVNGFNYVVEAHILNFNGDLYGKNITVYFEDKIRDIIKFSSLDELIEQLAKDKGFIL
ncbi:MAG: riboflavin biosynthesis protein RibF [Clostridia bacterium]|nr:riboflavin biosynthesis protein RibF [Clostridia bacterium]